MQVLEAEFRLYMIWDSLLLFIWEDKFWAETLHLPIGETGSGELKGWTHQLVNFDGSYMLVSKLLTIKHHSLCH